MSKVIAIPHEFLIKRDKIFLEELVTDFLRERGEGEPTSFSYQIVVSDITTEETETT